MKKILFVTAEANPFAASGGLGDVMGALPAAITKADSNYNTEVILPLYDTMKACYYERLTKVCDISFKLSWRSTGATIYKLDNDGVCYYFVENHYYFERGRLYGEWDDGERFAFFSLAVCEFMLQTNNIPDVLHANDWQSALTVIYLKTVYKSNPKLSSVRTLYTIHNIEFQGKFDKAMLGDVFALDNEYGDIVEFDGCINLMKGALITSDYVSTVSPNYACELKHDFFAFGLSEIIKSISSKMSGVINGIDYSYFSPRVGGDIYFPYDKRSIKSGKAKNKAALCEELSLEYDPKKPLIAMITRLANGKGIDLVLHIADELMQSGRVQLVVLGTGEREYEQRFVELSEKYSDLKALITFNRALSKKIYAAADMFLMPSKSEPCGLSQMISCSYATVPIVRAVGGLYDSIKPYDDSDSCNGFNFNNYNAHELLFAIKRAIEVFEDDKEWSRLRKNAMNSDFTWSTSAKEYIAIYNNLINW